jgi:choline dehydrogenase-like flavoprotein
VIGSGPGGAVTACTLAEAGRDVLLVEEGPFLPLESCSPFSVDEMMQKYRNGGMTVALGRAKVAYVEGRCVGGGSEVNSGIYHRIPPAILETWRDDFGVIDLDGVSLREHYEACERDLGVTRVPGGRTSPASRRLHEGAGKLEWHSLEAPRCFRYSAETKADAIPTGTKQSMTKTYVPRALRAGCRLLPDTRVVRLRRDGQRWLVCSSRGDIEAEHVFVAGGAIQTPALLRRSGITRNIGSNLQMHPTIKVVAHFGEGISDAAMPVPVHQVKEFAPALTFGCSISTRPHLAVAMLDHAEARAIENMPAQSAIYYVMVSGDSRGSVRTLPFFADPVIRFRMRPRDLALLARGLGDLCRLLFEAGALELYPALPGIAPLHSPRDLDRLPQTIAPDQSNLMTIHLFSSCPMGEARDVSACDSFGRVHDCDNLHVADASLLCSSPGVNPQGGIMALARRNAVAFLEQSRCIAAGRSARC